MSEFHIEVVTIGDILPHPNADRLEITKVRDYPVVIGKGSFQPGDLAVYIPVDAVVPDNDEFATIYQYTSKGRIKAAKLRGVFSMGVLHKPSFLLDNGVPISDQLGITKYEPPAEVVMGGDAIPDDGSLPKYTDIDGLRRYPDKLAAGEFVIITEKLHGACARYGWVNGTFCVGSKNQRLDPDGTNVWSRAAREASLPDLLARFPEHVFFGEVLGVQDMKYGFDKGNVALRFFDVLDLRDGRYLDHDAMQLTLGLLELPLVPVLTVAPWSPDLMALAEGSSVIAGHVREGIVIKPTVERWDEEIGRVILKLHGEGYLTRREGKATT